MFNKNSLTIKGIKNFQIKNWTLIWTGTIYWYNIQKSLLRIVFWEKLKKIPFPDFDIKIMAFYTTCLAEPVFMEVDSIVNYIYFAYFGVMMSKEWSSVQVQITTTARHLPHE